MSMLGISLWLQTFVNNIDILHLIFVNRQTCKRNCYKKNFSTIFVSNACNKIVLSEKKGQGRTGLLDKRNPLFMQIPMFVFHQALFLFEQSELGNC